MRQVVKHKLDRASKHKITDQRLGEFDRFVKNHLKPVKVLKVLQGDIWEPYDHAYEDEDDIYFMIVLEKDVEKDFNPKNLLSLNLMAGRKFEEWGYDDISPIFNFGTLKELKSFGYDLEATVKANEA